MLKKVGSDNRQGKKIAPATIFLIALTVALAAISFAIAYILSQQNKPVQTVNIQAAEKTYKKNVQLASLDIAPIDTSTGLLPTSSVSEEEMGQEDRLIESEAEPTVTEAPTETEATPQTGPTEIQIVTTPLVTIAESEIVSPTTATQAQTLPESGIGSLFPFAISIFSLGLIFLALVI